MQGRRAKDSRTEHVTDEEKTLLFELEGVGHVGGGQEITDIV